MYKNLVKTEYQNFNVIQKYVNLIKKHNQNINLTGFTKERLWKEGIYESLIALDEIHEGSLLDIGAGAGFPSVPLAIANSKINLTIYEPLQKRVRFLNEVKNNLNLNYELKIQRAETSGDFQKFDFITARAVASLRVLIEISYNLLKIGGQMIWLKGQNYQEELKEAESILKKLSLKPEIKTIKRNNLKTIIIKIKKTKVNFNFKPRSWSQIKKEAIK